MPRGGAQSAPEVVAGPKRRRSVTRPVRPYYRALKRLQVGSKRYRKGQIVPEAMGWPRVDAWVRSRHLELVE